MNNTFRRHRYDVCISITFSERHFVSWMRWSDSTALWGRHLDHTLGEASRPHIGGGVSTQRWGGISITDCERTNVSTATMGRHLDHTLGEASRSLMWEGRHLDRNHGEASRPHSGGGISITDVRGVVCDVWEFFVWEGNSKNKQTKIEKTMRCLIEFTPTSLKCVDMFGHMLKIDWKRNESLRVDTRALRAHHTLAS